MSDPDERYIEIDQVAGERLRVFVAEQMDTEPGFTQAKLVKRSGISHPTVRYVMHGTPGRRQRTELRQISATLGWTPKSIEDIIQGGDPTVVEPPAADRLDLLEQRIDDSLDEIRQELSLLRGAVEDLGSKR